MASDVLKLFYAVASSCFFYILAKLLQFGCKPIRSNVSEIPQRASDAFHPAVPNDRQCSEDTRTHESATRKDGLGGSLTKSCLSLNEAPELEEYELVKVIGRGSFSTVFMVENRGTRELNAMKVMSKVQVSRRRECISTERRVLHLALGCDFLVGLKASFESSKRFYFVIEIARGGDLMYHLQRMGKLEEEHARFYSAEICLALNFLHREGIIYRDLKLDNVLLDHLGHVKLTDFGMCKEGINRRGQFARTLCGTPNYLSPEMLRGEAYGFSVDWWAFGVLLYEMLAGCSPFNVDGSVGDSNSMQPNGGDLIRDILCKEIIIPSIVSEEAYQVLRDFLRRDPNERLGCHSETGFSDICRHPFFRSIDWDRLARKLITPPYKPRLSANRDSRCFDPHFTSEPVELPEDATDDFSSWFSSTLDGTVDFGSFSTFDFDGSPTNSGDFSDRE